MNVQGESAGTAARAIEGLALFVLVPVALAWARLMAGIDVPVIAVLIGVSVVTVALLRRDEAFDARAAFRGPVERRPLSGVLFRFGLAAVLLTALVATLAPERLFDLPRQRPRLWALVMVAYPVLSVLPQELLYRTFFFHRYGRLLGSSTVGASAAAFGLAHLLFGNWIAPSLTLVGGVLFASTFRRTGSLALTCIEHALYGQLIFTVGLGEFFYAGTVQSISR